ncbi:unnamed protein product [Medioppia subpectinata]|uniref:Uncharacterized protein n=1 Tax=Medioppia subpectinata TaxID=1979941 RepID=A0A7R9KUI6_9ACAR|nr:unnamed protein product [Medioppia subpectinata]CAG2108959.1 unnamed protein product [Medioppia subpectinata]
MFAPKKFTDDGFESHFQVNYLGHCLLVWALMPVMAASAQRCGQRSRVVNVSSSTHYARDLCLNDLQSEEIYSPFHSYAQSKLCQIMFTFSLNHWFATHQQYGQYVSVNALHPGVALTELYTNVWWVKIVPSLARALFRTSKEGAETILYATLSSQLEGIGGKYLEDCAIIRSSGFSINRQFQDQLWLKTWSALKDWTKDLPNPLVD